MPKTLEHIWQLYLLGRYELAKEELGKILRDEPNGADALGLLAFVVLAQGRQDDALAFASDALMHEPDNPWFHYILAVVRQHRGEAFDAIASLHEAIRLNPDDSEYYGFLSQCYCSTTLYENAYWCVLKALELNPEDTNSLLQYARIKYGKGRYVEAEVILKHILILDPTNPQCHQYLGWIRLNQFETGPAQEHFTTSLQNQPEANRAEVGLKKTEELHPKLNAKLFLQTEHWLTELETSKAGKVKAVENTDLKAMILQDRQYYTEEPRPITFTKGFKYEANPEMPLLANESISKSNRGMKRHTQKCIIGLVVAVLLIGLYRWFIYQPEVSKTPTWFKIPTAILQYPNHPPHNTSK